MKHIAFILLLCSVLLSCRKEDPELPDVVYDKVMVAYLVGRNGLDDNLKHNFDNLRKGYVPGKNDRKALVVISNTLETGNPSEISCPYVIRLYTEDGVVVADTIKAFSHRDFLSLSSTVEKVMNYIAVAFPSTSYGMVYSGHGSGWLPACSNPLVQELQVIRPSMAYSLGSERFVTKQEDATYELDVQDLAASLPYHLDYIVFDVCYMGGVEVAYELKDKCDKILFSQCAVHADGMNYTSMAHHLLENKSPDLEAVAYDYRSKYAQAPAELVSIAASVVNCADIERLASVCRNIFSKYADGFKHLDASAVQSFSTGSDFWFMDLYDMACRAGVSHDDLWGLLDALTDCVTYKVSIPLIGGKLLILNHCGLTTRLPSASTEEIDAFYKTFLWNQQTGFVE